MTNNEPCILLVEDDVELAQLIQEYLSANGFSVAIESDGALAEERILSESPDLVILDLMLPGKDGMSICKSIRDEFTNPIIMLTASGESVDHILGLELGADDYLSKPIEPRILLAHIRAVLRRAIAIPSPSQNVVQVGNITMDFSSRKVTVLDSVIDLTGPEYELLSILVEHRGNTLTRDELLNLWRGIDYDGQNRIVDITISQIRSKLATDNVSDKHIKTVRNKGYLLALEV
jgi:two-component system response regulator RstA